MRALHGSGTQITDGCDLSCVSCGGVVKLAPGVQI